MTVAAARVTLRETNWAWLLQDDLPGVVKALLVFVDVVFPVGVEIA